MKPFNYALIGCLVFGLGANAAESIDISVENRGGASGRSDASDALYVSLGYERESERTDVAAKVRIHPAGADDLQDTTSLHFNVEREFAIKGNWYHAANFGFDKHGLSQLSSGTAYFGSVNTATAAWTAGYGHSTGEVDAGYDFVANGVKVTSNVDLMGVSLTYDAVHAKGWYQEVGAHYDVGNARFHASFQTGLTNLPSPGWEDVDGDACGQDCETPNYSYTYGIAYVKHF